ncbi:MAG TPA: hypothetical protein DCP73_06735 [Chloroflexi bacterium]|nr:hypothetical protein [Chloroflexota bacterium]
MTKSCEPEARIPMASHVSTIEVPGGPVKVPSGEIGPRSIRNWAIASESVPDAVSVGSARSVAETTMKRSNGEPVVQVLRPVIS